MVAVQHVWWKNDVDCTIVRLYSTVDVVGCFEKEKRKKIQFPIISKSTTKKSSRGVRDDIDRFLVQFFANNRI
jgi:hypothetical protein